MTPTTTLPVEAREEMIAGWKPISDAPKDQEILVKGGEYQFAGETFPDWRPLKGVALVQFSEGNIGWRGQEMDGDFFYYLPTHYITIPDLLASAPRHPNELLEAAKALIADVRRRYPGEDLRCPYMIALDLAIRNAEQAQGTPTP